MFQLLVLLLLYTHGSMLHAAILMGANGLRFMSTVSQYVITGNGCGANLFYLCMKNWPLLKIKNWSLFRVSECNFFAGM